MPALWDLKWVIELNRARRILYSPFKIQIKTVQPSAGAPSRSILMLAHTRKLAALFFCTSLCMTLLPTSQAHARRMGPGQPTVSVGVKAAVGGASFATDNTRSDSDATLGYFIGGQARFALNSLVVFQPELGLSSKGGSASAGIFTVTQSLTYLHAPLLFGLTYPMGMPSELSPRLFIGPYVSYLVGGESRFGDLVEDVEPGDNVAALDAGIVIGFGLDIDMGGVVLTSDVRLERGLVGLSAPDQNVAYGDDRFNQVLSLNVGALFVF